MGQFKLSKWANSQYRNHSLVQIHFAPATRQREPLVVRVVRYGRSSRKSSSCNCSDFRSDRIGTRRSSFRTASPSPGVDDLSRRPPLLFTPHSDIQRVRPATLKRWLSWAFYLERVKAGDLIAISPLRSCASVQGQDRSARRIKREEILLTVLLQVL